MNRPRALDLFCKAGGATKGLQLAGFEVWGVDIEPQPHYCGDRFIQADALNLPLDLAKFDFIWASPPCQKFTSLAHRTKREYVNLIPQTRELLWKSGALTTIENVPGAPLICPIILCGSMFGLRVRRHRAFETTLPVLTTECRHDIQGRPLDVTGTGGSRLGKRPDGGGGNPNKPKNLADARDAMGIDWMNRRELSQAIPPAYSEFIGRVAMAAIERRRIAA